MFIKSKKKLLVLSTSLFSLGALADECDFKNFANELNTVQGSQYFAQYFSPTILHDFRLAKYREHNGVVLIQKAIQNIDDPDFGQIVRTIMKGHIARITQDKSLLYDFSIDSVSHAAERFITNIRDLSGLSDVEFFNQYLTNTYRDSTFHYELFKEGVIALSKKSDNDLSASCSYSVKTNIGRSGFIHDVLFEMDSTSGLIISPTPILAMFDFKGAAYTAEQLVDDGVNGIDFGSIPDGHLDLYSEGL